MSEFSTFYREMATLEKEAKRLNKPRNRGKQTVTPTANQPLDVPSSDPLYGVAPIRGDHFPAARGPGAGAFRGMTPAFDPEAEMRASGLLPPDDSWVPEHWRGMEGGQEAPRPFRASSPAETPIPQSAAGRMIDMGYGAPELGPENRARIRGDLAAEDYSPLSREWGWVDPLAGLGTSIVSAVRDIPANVRGDAAAVARDEDRREWWRRAARQGFGVPDMMAGLAGMIPLDDPSNPHAIPRETLRRWEVDRADRALDAEAESDPRYLGRMDEFVVEVPRYRGVEGAARHVGSVLDDLWGGVSDAARDARRQYVTADELEEYARSEGRLEDADDYEMAARQAAGQDALYSGLSALEVVPGIGLIDLAAPVAASATRSLARQPFNALEARVPDLLLSPDARVARGISETTGTPITARQFAAETGFTPEGQAARLTPEAQGVRDTALLAGGGALGADLLDGSFGDDPVPSAIAAGAGIALGQRHLIPRAAEAAQARRLGDSVPRSYEGAPSPQGDVIDVPFEVVEPRPQRRFEAAVQDPETGRVYAGLDHGEAIDAIPDDAVRARLQAMYDADPSFGGFNVDGRYMAREEGLASLRAERPQSVRIGEQVNRDGSVSPSDPIDWDADIAPERASWRDLGLGAAAGGGLGAALYAGNAEASDGVDADALTIGGLAAALGVPAALVGAYLNRNRLGRMFSRAANDDIGAALRGGSDVADDALSNYRISSQTRVAPDGSLDYHMGQTPEQAYGYDPRNPNRGNAVSSLREVRADAEVTEDVLRSGLADMDSRELSEIAQRWGVDPHQPKHDVIDQLVSEYQYDQSRGGTFRYDEHPDEYTRPADVWADDTPMGRYIGPDPLSRINAETQRAFDALGDVDIGAAQSRLGDLADAAGARAYDETANPNNPGPLSRSQQSLISQQQIDDAAERLNEPDFRPRYLNSALIGSGLVGGGGGYALGEMFDGEAQADENGVPLDGLNLIPWLMAGGGAALFGGRQFLRNADNTVSMSGARGSRFAENVNPRNSEQSAPASGTNRARGRATGNAREEQIRRNARIMELVEEMQPTGNLPSGAANPGARLGIRLDNGHYAIAERMRAEGYPDVTRNIVTGVINRERARARRLAERAASEAEAPASAIPDSDEAAAARLGIPVDRYRQISARNPLAIGALALGGGALALGAGEAEAQDLREILPLPEDMDFRNGDWDEPRWTQVQLPDGSEGLSRVMIGPDGQYYTIVARQLPDASIEVLGHVRPTPGAPGPMAWGGAGAPDPIASPQGRRLGEPEAIPDDVEPDGPETDDGFDRDDLRIPAAIAAGLGARYGLRRAGANGFRGVPREIMAAGAAGGTAYAMDPDDPLGALTLGAINPAIGRFGDQVFDDLGRIGDDATRRIDGRVPGGGVLPEQVRGYEFDRSVYAPHVDEVRNTERALEGQERQIQMARESGDETRRRARMLDPNAIPEGPPPSFTERRGGREVSVFGEIRQPRQRTPLPPVAERAAEGALRGVDKPTMQRIANDLDVETEGVSTPELRKRLARSLAQVPDLVAFLGRYGVGGAALAGAVASESRASPPPSQ